MARASVFLYRDFEAYDEKAASKNLTPAALPALEALRESLAALDPWEREALHAALNATAEALAVKLGSVAQPLRVAVSGTAVSPPMDLTLELLGKARTLARIDRAREYIAKKM
jgi:glutamyl-tRNA synthetase